MNGANLVIECLKAHQVTHLLATQAGQLCQLMMQFMIQD